jgi:hypothetical protein
MFLESPPPAQERKEAETQKWRSNVSSTLSRGINPKAKSLRQHFCDTQFIGARQTYEAHPQSGLGAK